MAAEDTGNGPGTGSPDKLDRVLEGILGDESSPDDRMAQDEGTAEADAAEVAGILEDAYAGGRRLARAGGCLLMASDDGMTATLRGRMPEGSRFPDVLALLAEGGVTHGIVQARLQQVLPRRRAHGKASRGQSPPEERPEVVVAEGTRPVAPPPARIEYRVALPAEGEGRDLRAALEEYSFEPVRRCPVAAPLVVVGQVLAEVVVQAGKDGRDVFGQVVPAPEAAGALLQAGQNAELSPDGQRCTATQCGYPVVLDGALAVLSPIWVPKDLMRAYFVWCGGAQVPAGFDRRQLMAALESEGIVHGVLRDAVAALCRQLQQEPGAVERLSLVARGTEAEPSQDAHYEFVCEPELTKYYGEIRRVLSRSPTVAYLEDYAHGLAGKPVSDGEQLAVKRPPRSGGMGRDVFGEEFAAAEPADATLEVGDHIRVDEQAQTCYSRIYGYLGIGRNRGRMEVVSPLWVARDRMTACFVHLPQLGEPHAPEPQEIDALLGLAGVCRGVDQRAVAVLCERLRQVLPMPLAVRLAAGQPAEPGQDGRFAFAVDLEAKAGFFRPDGSVDYRLLNLAPMVAAEQLLGHRHPAQAGRDGWDVTGRALPAQAGAELHVETGRGVRLERVEGEPDRYLAECDGELVTVERSLPGDTALHLAVHPVLRVDGDVDYHSGNIDFPGSVHVSGAVRPGFVVRALGNIVIGDAVEEGARLEAQGNVVVRNGILGESTRITAAGAVFARYVTAAHVEVGGDVNVAEYLFSASVRAAGEVVVWGASGSRTSGLVAGGRCMAGGSIRVRGVGTEASAPAQLIAGVDWKVLQEASAAQRRLDQYSQALRRTLASLQAENLDPAKLRQMLLQLVLKARGPQRQVVARAARNLLALQQRVEAERQRKGVLEAALAEQESRAAVEVTGRVAARTRLRVGRHAHVVAPEESQVTQVRFSVGKAKDGKERLQITSG
ncbi:MAG: flagellar assembly protein A [Candidatus Latescibacterota bacterium]